MTRRLWIALLVLCAIGAAAALRRIAALAAAPTTGPAPLVRLDAHFASEAAPVLVHVVPGLLFVLLVPLQFMPSLRNRHPRVHRWVGRVILSLSLIIGTSALWLSAHPTGGIVESAATTFFGCFFLLSLILAWWHIRHGRAGLHREWIIRMVSIALEHFHSFYMV